MSQFTQETKYEALLMFSERLANRLDISTFVENKSANKSILIIAWLIGLIDDSIYMPPAGFDIEDEVAEAYISLLSKERIEYWKKNI